MEAHESDSTTTSSIIAVVVGVPVLLIMLYVAAPIPLVRTLERCGVPSLYAWSIVAPLGWLYGNSDLYSQYVDWQESLF